MIMQSAGIVNARKGRKCKILRKYCENISDIVKIPLPRFPMNAIMEKRLPHTEKTAMKTLIELYDERPIENVLGTEVFRPEETLFICPPEVAGDRTMRQSLEAYFASRGCPSKVTFIPVSLLDAVQVEKTLRQVLESINEELN